MVWSDSDALQGVRDALRANDAILRCVTTSQCRTLDQLIHLSHRLQEAGILQSMLQRPEVSSQSMTCNSGYTEVRDWVR